MVEHDIKNHVDAASVRLIHQCGQFFFGGGAYSVAREALVYIQKILRVVTRIGVGKLLKLGVLEYRRDPEGANTQLLQVSKLLARAFKRSSLVKVEFTVPL